jgi:hypothetical protein
MESQGIEFIGPTEMAEDGYAWSHFRARAVFTRGRLSYTLNQEMDERRN